MTIAGAVTWAIWKGWLSIRDVALAVAAAAFLEMLKALLIRSTESHTQNR